MKTPKELEDAVRQYQNGNADSFNRIYKLSYGYLHTCVIHIVRDGEIAADMLQETYLEISRNLSQLKSAGDFLSWASAIGNRKCYAYLKKQRDVLVRVDGDQDGDAQDFFESIADDEAFIPETILQDREKQRLIQEIIDGLSDMQRLCIIGFYYRGQSIEEIAQELEIPANTVKSHLSRAKAKIKDAVIALDKEKGTRLYSVAPFMLLLLSKEAEACEAGPMPEALKTAMGGSGVKTLGARNSIGQKILQAGMRYKLAAGAVLAAVVIGGAAALIHYANTSGSAGVENPSEAVLAGVQTETDENLQADTAGESEPEEPETVESTETGVQEERRMLEFDLTEYESVGSAGGGVVPVKKNGLWGAVNYNKEEIVPCEYPYYKSHPNLAGYFVLGSLGEDNYGIYNLFAPDGTKIYEGADYVMASGNFYAVCSKIGSWEDYNNRVARVDYYDYDGNLVLSTDYDPPIYWSPFVMGSCDGETPVCRQSRRQFGIGEGWGDKQAGVLYADGTVRWNPEIMMANLHPWGTPNHGYTIERQLYDTAIQCCSVYTEDHQQAFDLFLNKEVVEPYWNWDNWKHFYHDGATFYHYGSKAVWEINGTDLLVDLTLAGAPDADDGRIYVDWDMMTQVAQDHIPRGMFQAAYDYIEMDMNRYWLVQKGDQWGYIDHEGNEMAMYEDASGFANGYALIVEDGTAFRINENFEIVEECGDADSVGCYGELLGIIKDDTLYLLNSK